LMTEKEFFPQLESLLGAVSHRGVRSSFSVHPPPRWMMVIPERRRPEVKTRRTVERQANDLGLRAWSATRRPGSPPNSWLVCRCVISPPPLKVLWDVQNADERKKTLGHGSRKAGGPTASLVPDTVTVNKRDLRHFGFRRATNPTIRPAANVLVVIEKESLPVITLNPDHLAGRGRAAYQRQDTSMPDRPKSPQYKSLPQTPDRMLPAAQTCDSRRRGVHCGLFLFFFFYPQFAQIFKAYFIIRPPGGVVMQASNGQPVPSRVKCA